MKKKKIIMLALTCTFGTLLIKTRSNTSKYNNSLIIGFGGDTMIGRMVNETLATLPEAKKYSYSWGNILPILHATDLNIINLETTITTSQTIVPKAFNFKTDPENVNVLKSANIGIVNLANNHVLDFGEQGLVDTITYLDNAHIEHVGAGINMRQAKKPIILTKKGIRIGILGYTDNEPTWLATQQKPGTNYIAVGDVEAVANQIKAVRPHCDLLIITTHWGPNMRIRPSQEFIDFAHAIIDAGADIIHGHSAHIFQGVEIYKKKLIMYDTGDLVDDYMVDPTLRNNLSFLFLVSVDKDGPKKLQLIPTKISVMQVNKAEGNDKKWSLDRMQKLSQELGTYFNSSDTVEIPRQ